MREYARAWLLCALAATVAGCATQADLAEIRQEQHSIRNQLADTRATLDSVQHELATTRGKVQENHHAEQADSRFQNVEARLAALEQGHGVGSQSDSAGGDVSMAPAPAATPGPEQARAEVPAATDRDSSDQAPDSYRRALALVHDHEYDRAIQQFRDFLRTNPDSPLAGNAHYWIGESYYTLGDYSQAILQYNEVRQHYPKSDRASAALLKIGLAFLEMGNKSEAKLAFQKVVTDYPASAEAGQAREKLKSLGA